MYGYLQAVIHYLNIYKMQKMPENAETVHELENA
jgi:hypothetical protein